MTMTSVRPPLTAVVDWSGRMSRVSALRDVPPRWEQLVDDEEGLVVVELDDAAAEGAPWPELGYQLVVTVTLQDPDHEGQPYDEEHEVLGRWREALQAALGDDGRIVATLTADGAREHVAYIRDPEVVTCWQQAPPPGLGSHDAKVALVPDPTWLGLREIAGLLGPDEEPLVLPL